MAGKHLVCQGASCICKYGAKPDKLKVLSHQKEYINDLSASNKLIANTKDIGTTFESGSFGSCSKQRSACRSIVTEWSNFYDKIKISNGGYPLWKIQRQHVQLEEKIVSKLFFMDRWQK